MPMRESTTLSHWRGDRELDGCRPDQSAMKSTCQSRKQQPGAYGALIWLPRCVASCELGRAKERDHLKIVAEAVPQFNDNTRPCFEKRKSHLHSSDAGPCPKAIIRVPPPARANADLPPAAMPIMTPARMPVPPTVEVQVPMPARITGMAARMAVISKRRRREHYSSQQRRHAKRFPHHSPRSFLGGNVTTPERVRPELCLALPEFDAGALVQGGKNLENHSIAWKMSLIDLKPF
jgi:hypothetical protein